VQTYAIKLHNFLRFGEKNNTLVFDLTENQKTEIAAGELSMDEVFDKVANDPVAHVIAAQKRGIEPMLGIAGMIGGDPEQSNGVGKSSILEGMCYARYEKISRKTRNSDKTGNAGNSIITKINGKYPDNLSECYVEEIVEDNGLVYRIKRGRKVTKTHANITPILECQCYNTPNDHRGGHVKKSTKEALEEIITMDYDVFLNGQMFAQNDAGKFLMGTDKTKKEMLISLLHLEDVVGGCLDLIRKKKRAYEKEAEEYSAKISVLEKQLLVIRQELIMAKDIDEENLSASLIKAIQVFISRATDKVSDINKEIDDIDTIIETLGKSSEIEKLNNIRQEGAKAKEDKAKKKEEWSKLEKKWKDIISSAEENIDSQNRLLVRIKGSVTNKENSLQALETEISSFDSDKAEKQIKRINEVKASKIMLLESKQKQEDKISEVKQKLAVLLHKNTTDQKVLDKLSAQLEKIGEEFVCSECYSNVTKSHIEERHAERASEMEKSSICKEALGNEEKKINSAISVFDEKLKKAELILNKEAEISTLIEKAEGWGKQKSTIVKDIEEFNSEIKEITANVDISTGKITQYNSDFEKEKLALTEEVNVIIAELNRLAEAFKGAEKDASNITDKIEDLKKQKSVKQNLVSTISKELGSLSQKEQQVVSLRDEIEKIKTEAACSSINLKRYKTLEVVFGLNGIQTKIVKKYLPLLNVYIKEFLDILTDGEMSVHFFINDSSKVDLKIIGGTADTYEMLSGGEQVVVRLATDIGLALLSFVRSTQKPEVVCLDEIFGSLDKSHVSKVFKMLNHLKDKFSRVLIISHKDEVQEEMPVNIIVEKSSGIMGVSEIKRIE
tara:strand:- start:27488 stop:30013 length:2526 start_codon:yes stop_codon:yes gene_type:complete